MTTDTNNPAATTNDNRPILSKASFEIFREKYEEPTEEEIKQTPKGKMRTVIAKSGKVHFVLKTPNGPPIKLGDGTFGVVFKGDLGGVPCAIKLLYANQSLAQSTLFEFDNDNVDDFIKILKEKGAFKDVDTAKVGERFEEIKKLIIKEGRNIDGLRLSFAMKFGRSSAQLKIIYDALSLWTGSTAVDRFRREVGVSDLLRDFGQRRGVFGTVEVHGGTTTFTSKDVYEELKPHFSQLNASISDYALVMDFYEYTLKDLLEAGPSKHRSTNDKNVLVGYKRLRKLDWRSRVKTALQIIQQPASGLQLLHETRTGERMPDGKRTGRPLFHLDIKPANVFIQPNNGMNPNAGFQIVLGDLGNLPPKPQSNLLSDVAAEDSLRKPILEKSLGSLHYRSPEQLEDMDVAYVEVSLTDPRLSPTPTGDSSNTPDGAHENAGQAGTGLTANKSPESEFFSDADDRGDGIQAKPAEATFKPKPAEPRRPREVFLTVRDPKFKNTFIEKGDFVIFNKESRTRTYEITQDMELLQTGEMLIVIQDNYAQITADDRTQAEFHKRQAHRTDLFGIGALVYDIITGGESPERFYESIRRFEVSEDDDAKPGSLSNVTQKYESVQRGQAEVDEPELRKIFEPFSRRDGPSSQWADSDIVEFILSCMLYKAEGTFYHQSRNIDKDKPEGAIALANAQIRKLLEKYPSQVSELLIWDVDREPEKLDEPGGTLREEINLLQGYVTSSKDPTTGETPTSVRKWMMESDPLLKGANRLLLGAFHLKKLVSLVQQHVPTEGTSDSRSFFYQLLASRIDVEWEHTTLKLSLPITTYKDREKDYYTDLLIRSLERISRDPFGPYVPLSFVRMRRRIRLAPTADVPSETEPPTSANKEGMLSTVPTAPTAEKHVLRYTFEDSSPIGTKIADGDWIVYRRVLWSTQVNVDAGTLTLTRVYSGQPDSASTARNTASNLSNTGEDIALFYSNLEPNKYYLEMLALYVQHLIFVNSPFTQVTRDRFDLYAMLKAMGIEDLSTLRLVAPTPDKKSPLEFIHECYAHLLLKFLLHESEDSYYQLWQSAAKYSQEDANKLFADDILTKAQANAGALLKHLKDYMETSTTGTDQRPAELAKLTDPQREEMKALQNTRKQRDIEGLIKNSGIITIIAP